MTSNQNFFCPACSRLFSDHDYSELIECALKLCNGNEVADIACGVDEQLIRNQLGAIQGVFLNDN